ncbi:MAG: hypothetical protein OEV08_14495 [Nitrospira sp.]|nr:hypothetical protein [Nitrospira sp.]
MSDDVEKMMEAGRSAMLSADYKVAADKFSAAFLAMDGNRQDSRWVECGCMLAESSYMAYGGASLPSQCAEYGGNVAGLLDLLRFRSGEQGNLRVGRTWARLAAMSRMNIAGNKPDLGYQYSLHALEMLERGRAPEYELVPVLCTAVACRPDSRDFFGRVALIVGMSSADIGKRGNLSRFEQWDRIVRWLGNNPPNSRLAVIDCCLSAALDCINFEDFYAAERFLMRAREEISLPNGMDAGGQYTSFVEQQLALVASKKNA